MRNNLSGKYILMNDIDLSGIADWNPIGESSTDSTKEFKGILDGNGHVIKNLKSTSGGIFGAAKNAELKNITLDNVNIHAQSTTNVRAGRIGGLAGETSNCNITNCSVTSTDIQGDGKGWRMGGLIGNAYQSNITNCSIRANLKDSDSKRYDYSYIGGIVGDMWQCTLTNSCFSGNIESSCHAAGLIGELDYDDASTISNCYSTGSVKGNKGAGGLIGFAQGSHGEKINISNCYTTCDVTGSSNIGVLFGDVTFEGTANNIWGLQKNSDLNLYGKTPWSDSKITNAGAISQKEFYSPEFWETHFDTTAWDTTNSIPPILKDVRGQIKNWYFKESNNEFRIQTGGGSDPSANALFVDTGFDISAMDIDLSTTDGCLDAVNCVKAALDAIAQKTADIGIAQSRLETISNVNTTKIENLTAAYSTVTAADEAEEVANYTKSQIMAQTAASLMTQVQAFQTNLLLRMINSLG